jgi:hypothetical protein
VPRIIDTMSLHEKTVQAAATARPVVPDPTVWAAALELAHGDATVLHVESRTVVWVGTPVVRKVRAPRRRGVRQ